MKRFAVLLVLVAAALAVANHNPPRVLAAPTVCPSGCTFSSIQAAINAASPGSTITVGPGCYFENLDIEGFENPGITIQSTNGVGPHTIDTNPNDAPFISSSDPCLVSPYTTTAGAYIDGDCDGAPTVYIYDSQVTIVGFTIQDGCLDAFDYSGAGVWNDSYSSTQLSNDFIFYNFNVSDVSGTYCSTSTRNGGVFNYYYSALQLYSGQVVNNVANCSTAGVMNVSETGYVDPPAGTPAHSTTPHRATRAPQRGGPRAGSGVQPWSHTHPAASGQARGTNAHGHSKARNRAAGTLAAAGSPTPGTGMTSVKTTVTYNFDELGTGGVNNAGTAQLNSSFVTNNYGGCFGGVFAGDDNNDATDLTALNAVQIQNNVGEYYNCSSSENAVAGGLGVENRTTLTNSTVKFNSYDYNPGEAASGVLLDPDDDQEAWDTVTLSSGSVVANNTPPPQCASGDSFPSPC